MNTIHKYIILHLWTQFMNIGVHLADYLTLNSIPIDVENNDGNHWLFFCKLKPDQLQPASDIWKNWDTDIPYWLGLYWHPEKKFVLLILNHGDVQCKNKLLVIRWYKDSRGVYLFF